jgi:hypothetical protein
MNVIVTSDNRIRPRDENAADEERAKLHRTMIAYAGTYTLDGDKVTPSCGHLIERKGRPSNSLFPHTATPSTTRNFRHEQNPATTSSHNTLPILS